MARHITVNHLDQLEFGDVKSQTNRAKRKTSHIWGQACNKRGGRPAAGGFAG